MRVLHLVAIPQLTGAAEPTVDLVRGLESLGVQVDLHVDTGRPGNLIETLESLGRKVPRALVLSTKAGPWAALRDAWRLRRIVKDYDLVHTHLSHDHSLAVFAGARRIVRTIHAERALAPGLGRRFLFRNTAGFLVASEKDANTLRANHHVTEIEVLPGSVDLERFHPDSVARQRTRAELGTQARFVIGCVARFQAGRRHENLLEALKIAIQHRPELCLVLIGHGETEAALRARAQGLGDAVLFPGYKRHDLNDYLAGLDAAAWLVPGNDATSRAVLQAMAVSLPVIGGHQGAIAEAVDDNTGWRVDPDDPQTIAAAMIAAASNPELARQKGATGLAKVVHQFSPRGRAQKAYNFYRRLGAPP